MNGTAALSLFKEVFSETADCHINYDNALAIEDALHQLYIKSEEDGTYWVAACQAVVGQALLESRRYRIVYSDRRLSRYSRSTLDHSVP